MFVTGNNIYGVYRRGSQLDGDTGQGFILVQASRRIIALRPVAGDGIALCPKDYKGGRDASVYRAPTGDLVRVGRFGSMIRDLAVYGLCVRLFAYVGCSVRDVL